ncbi:MAG: hypothetical protein JXL67_00155, partial [Calditrichaeota bacterium]|nr:hypothetical protein [Calditrichota bacterium]
MKTIFYLLLLLLCSSILIAQENQKYSDRASPDPTILKIPANHDPFFRDFPVTSFYESRQSWQVIIDSTWGPGLPLIQKETIFNHYANTLHDKFDGFLSLGMNDWTDWYSLRDSYYSRIDSATSRGAFSAIMSQLAHALNDIHTEAIDSIIYYTPLNPGIPILVLSGFVSVEHFGAVLTVLPDSTLLVLRVVHNHPLGLQPGDIILGYEGIPWKILVHQLFHAGLPTLPGC